MSYALDSTQTNPRLRDTDYNHFVIFDPFNVIACHDFEVHLQILCKPLRNIFPTRHNCYTSGLDLPVGQLNSNGAGCGSFHTAAMPAIIQQMTVLICPAAGPHALLSEKAEHMR